MNPVNRRDFIKASGSIATSFLAAPDLAWSCTAGGGASQRDYRALVCIFLAGGNDSFNMLVPRSGPEYRAYAKAREDLAIPRHDLLPVTAATYDSRKYGLHPAMTGIHGLFERQLAACVANVGSLVEPVTRESYYDGSARLPPRLFAHQCRPDAGHLHPARASRDTGWLWRMAAKTKPGSSQGETGCAGSKGVANPRSDGRRAPVCEIAPDGSACFARSGEDAGASHGHADSRAAAGWQGQGSAFAGSVSGLVTSSPELRTAFPRSPLGARLRTAAQLIAAREQLRHERQVFFIVASGFDTHANQVEVQPLLLGGLSEAIAAFYAATVELNVADEVTTFTQSEFGRTLTSSGGGTDHAWGGNQLVVGGGVRGGDIYGRYPSLEIGSADDLGGGRIIPSTSTDQFAATLARWFGIPAARLDGIVPHIASFPRHDLGFMH